MTRLEACLLHRRMQALFHLRNGSLLSVLGSTLHMRYVFFIWPLLRLTASWTFQVGKGERSFFGFMTNRSDV